jgi:hypothetical protein
MFYHLVRVLLTYVCHVLPALGLKGPASRTSSESAASAQLPKRQLGYHCLGLDWEGKRFCPRPSWTACGGCKHFIVVPCDVHA